ncbi:MAG TPA: L,D-transpeptidase [Anaerolineales bacterium]|nr:L,D-transpeptidase [Anaerolineales bacterium]
MKLSSATLLGILFSELHLDKVRAAPATMLGRVLYPSLIVRDAPAFSGKKVRSYKRDNVIDIVDEVAGGTEGDYNRVWYHLGNNEYVYSGGVQPVQQTLNEVVTNIPETGILGQVTIPYADSLWAVNRSPAPGPRLYYATNHWITALVTDRTDGSLWYKAYDNLFNSYYYTRPQWVHIFSPEELSPLSAQVPENEKHIEVNLNRQVLMAFEMDVLVYAARVATGQKNYETPSGLFHTFHKRPTYHMTGGADITSVFDLPGVPWDSYFTDNGAALHGTFWHNDFGHTHSHGCVNMQPQDAKWIYRWTTPTVPAGERLKLEPGVGTLVRVSQA